MVFMNTKPIRTHTRIYAECKKCSKCICAPNEQNTHIHLLILYLDWFNCIHDLLELMKILSYDFFLFLSLSFAKSNYCYYAWQIGLRVLIRYFLSTTKWLGRTSLVMCFVLEFRIGARFGLMGIQSNLMQKS